jgi:putative membrane protein
MPIHRQLLPSLAIMLLFSAPALAQQQMGGPQHNATRPNTTQPNTTQQRELSQKDLDFIKNAAMGGMTEVELGKIAEQKAHSPDVKSFGARMVHDHSRANEQLATIAKKRGAAVPQQLDTEHTQMRERLTKMQGEAFDRSYIRMMVVDHDKDIKAFRQEAQLGHDRELKRFARETLAMVEQHDKLAHDIERSMVAVGSSRGPR